MSDLVNEQLSALMDGELPPEETALLLRRLEREPELAQRLARYRAMGDALRGDRVKPSVDFSRRVSAAVAAEPAPMVGVRRPPAIAKWRLVRPLVGFGVAAAVGALAVVLVTRGPGSETAPTQSVASVSVEAPAAAPTPVTPRALVATAVIPASNEPVSYVTPAAGSSQLRPISGATLANYVASHARMSGSLGGRDVLIHLVADPAPGDASQP